MTPFDKTNLVNGRPALVFAGSEWRIAKLAAGSALGRISVTDRASRALPHGDTAAKREAVDADLVRPTHRHKKRGTEYVLIGYGKMQADGWLKAPYPQGPLFSVDMAEVAIYRSVDDGSLWCRPREEFDDGRFDIITNAGDGK
jgi:hypothetical protein